MKSLLCRVSGRVQGVWFRAWAKDKARKLGLAGWVKNLFDGRVETLAQGDDQALEQFRELLHKGPPLSRVDEVACEVVDEEPFSDFSITR